MNAVFRTMFAVFCCLTALAVTADAQTFVARAEVRLCPDYPLGGNNLEFGYRIGPVPFTPLQIAGMNIDNSTNTATVDLNIPSGFGRNKMSVVAFCRNGSGLSTNSNQIDISNCESLALHDTDDDGINDAVEDLNCSNSYDSEDLSDSRTPDTDGDGSYDYSEAVASKNPRDPYDSPAPRIVSSQPFDFDGDGNSDPVSWTPTTGEWKFLLSTTNELFVFGFGANGDIPFTYANATAGIPGDVGVVRTNSNGQYDWLFSGPGFQTNSIFVKQIENFGRPGDFLVPGPWEIPGQTSPAIARPENGTLTFYVYKRDGTIWSPGSIGQSTDIPVPANYLGNGVFQMAVYRASQNLVLINNQSFSLSKSTFQGAVFVNGDLTGDGRPDISFYNPRNSLFTTLISTASGTFNAPLGNVQNPSYYANNSFIMSPGTFVPLNYFKRNGRILYTILEHSTGRRIFRLNNNPNNPPTEIIFGEPGDWQG